MDKDKPDAQTISVTVQVPKHIWARIKEIALKEETTAQRLTTTALSDFLRRWD
jgi:predicted transcriptional regulator